ncbi:SAC3/GANP family [Fragilaria crotonensis]|nr:SAC3/GANP family [Fragilaria crotonensis]
MSGFGNNTFGSNLGGFGTSGFGTGTTGGFTSGFGAAPAPGGFGAPSGFGGDAQPTAGGFGASSTPIAFGASSVGFGAKIPAPGGFGAASASDTHGFGPSPPLGGFGVATPGSGGFGTPSVPATFGANAPIAGGLGASSTSGGFGTSTPISGGFGTPAATGGFGAAPLVSGGFSSISSGGFSAAPAPFGAAQVHSGFGAPLAPSVFGTPSAATGFSTAPSPTAFVGSGSSSSFTGFGVSVNPSFGHAQSGSSGFTTSSSSTFGASAPNSSGFGSTNVSSSFAHGSGFAAAPSTSTSFGAPVHTPFSQPAFPMSQPGSQSSSAFGTSSNAFGSSSAFGNVSGFGGGSTFHSQPVAPGNPFGAGTGAPAPAMTFGSSASVLQTTEVNMHDGSNDFDDGGFHGGITNQSGFGQPFATPSSLNPTAQAFAPQHFSPAPTFGMSSFGKPSSNDDDMGDEMPIHSPIPEASMTLPTPDVTFDEGPDTVAKNKEEELARLKAKLAAKKKKLEEAKLRKSASENSPPPSPKRHVTSPNPTVVQERNNGTTSTEHASLAERNAFRFAPKVNATRSHLPDDLEPITVPSQNEFDVMDLQNAKSLVGTCQFMCPDDELKRRENEGDIQLLETIHPDIHPVSWNLRNTAVKRFRRSAADYKLDIPELVRPPDVLERVCGYLEEWVMERDRQGPDPRFSTGVAPTPLEVYQFIWDRTRMVRKDFILQNYVGTGGKCDARAVRCHERIARWHAMCEHQLSHIPDFVRMQSQQNIAEMGQAMKTLNLFYDDSLGRSTVDVADETGRGNEGTVK